MNTFKKYEVGDCIFPPSNDKVLFDLSPSGCILRVHMQHPTAKEKRNYKNGVPQFHFAIVQDVIFFLARFGLGPWIDAPFSMSFSTHVRNHCDIPTPQPGQGLSLHFMLIDASTGILVSQRIIGLPHDLSVAFLAAVQVQPEIPDSDLRVYRIQQEYSTADLLKEVVI